MCVRVCMRSHSETAWPMKAKLNPGHMTKMAAMSVYSKIPSKIFFSGTSGPISTKLGMKHL